MNCDTTSGALVAWHFGTIDDPEREDLEAHLVQCARCVREFVALKRDVEFASVEKAHLPSPAMRARVRRSVADAVQPRRTVRRSRLVLAFGAGAAAATAALVLVLAGGEPRVPPHDPNEHPVDVDSAEPSDLSLQYL